MTAKQVAKYLGFHEMTIYRMFQKGTLPAFKVGGHWRSSRRILDKYVADQSRVTV